MTIYKHILLAIDFQEDTQPVIEKAQALAKERELQKLRTKLSLLHVVQPIHYAYGPGLLDGMLSLNLNQLEQNSLDDAQQKIFQLATRLAIPYSQTHVVLGHTVEEIHRYANELQTDLVVIGSHGRSGLELLLGSTANGVLHGMNCDVLAVRV